MLSLWALAQLNPDEERVVRYAAETIVAGLSSADAQVRSGAARALAEFEGHEDIVGPALLELLEDDDPAVVGNALDALAALGLKIIDRVAAALQKEEMRHHAARVLFRMGPEAAPAVPALVKAMKQEIEDADDLAFRTETQLVLAAIGADAAPAVPELVGSLASDDHEIRGTACYALGKIGPDASAAVAALEQRTSELSTRDKLPFLWALLRILPGDQAIAEKAAPALIEALDDEDALARLEAALALGSLGDLARPAIAKLTQLLDDPNDEVRAAAEQALKKLQGEGN
jgi:HEAT repeat protein